MVLYNKSKIDRLKIKFDGIENVNSNYSQSYQDMFVLSMLNGKKNGTFVEIGAHDPKFINNTFLLENQFAWGGISIDIDPGSQMGFSRERRNSKFILQDALTIDYKKIFEENNFPKQIDYLQIDIEPLINSYNCLKLMPFEHYRFSVITFETDYYDTNTEYSVKEMVRKESREILESNGYKLVVGDVESNIGYPYEDWYVDPRVIELSQYSCLLETHESLLPDNFMLKK